MKIFLVAPVIAAGLFFATSSDEPSERQMQLAFENALSVQVRNALEFANEAGGPDAVAEIRRNGTDRFDVNAFQKLKCEALPGKSGYLCNFRVDLRLVTGPMERALTGRFQSGNNGIVFVDEI